MREYTNEQLCEHIKKGEKWATEQLIDQNKGFVYDCAHKTYKAYRVSRVLSETDEDAASICESQVDIVHAKIPARITPAKSDAKNPCSANV